jgi:hypothetical protein
MAGSLEAGPMDLAREFLGRPLDEGLKAAGFKLQKELV